jgi:heat shock protein HslJ
VKVRIVPVRRLLLTVILGALLAAGCGGGSDSSSTQASTPTRPTPGPTPQGPSVLYGKNFRARSATDNGRPHELVPDAPVVLSFGKQGRGIYWDDGCNGLGTKSGRVTQDALSISPHSVYTTLVKCAGPRNDQELWISAFFNANPHWQLSGKSLTLTNQRTTLELVEVPAKRG